jgi:hypothetical protein
LTRCWINGRDKKCLELDTIASWQSAWIPGDSFYLRCLTKVLEYPYLERTSWFNRKEGPTSSALPVIDSTSFLSSPIIPQTSSGAPSNAHHPFTSSPTRSASSSGLGYVRRTLPRTSVDGSWSRFDAVYTLLDRKRQIPLTS